MQNQKTLHISFTQDVTHANDAQIEAFKALWRATLEQATSSNVSFEVREIDPMARIKSMLRLVRSEYEVGDDPTAIEEPDSAIGEVEEAIDEP